MYKKASSLLLLMIVLSVSLILQGCGQSQGATDAELNADADVMMDDELTVSDDSVNSWILDSERSVLTYSSSRLAGSSHTGTVDIGSGNITFDETGFTGGEFVIDMTTVSESKDNRKFLSHVMSEDFFDAEKYPEARFVITHIEAKEETNYQITGDLTIRGITKAIIFNASAVGDGDELFVSADFTIDRTRWDIIFDSGSFFRNLGEKAIKDLISFELDLVFDLKDAL